MLHPYHGSLYFNATLSNGFDFYQSVPFVMPGSLMWEYFLENEPPSINDLIATTAGGAMLGEVTCRLSNRVLDNWARGVNRVLREIVAGFFSPIHSPNAVKTHIWIAI